MNSLQRVVTRQDATDRRSGERALPFWFVVVASTSLVVALFSVAITQAYLVKSQQHVDEVRAEILESELERSRLQREVDIASAPQSIIERADALGMVPSGEPTHLRATRIPSQDSLPEPQQGTAELK